MEGYILGNRMRRLRGDKTLQSIANEIGMNRVTLLHYEDGSRHPNAEALYKIAQYYQVSIDYLVGLPSFAEQDWDKAYQMGRQDMKNEILEMIDRR